MNTVIVVAIVVFVFFLALAIYLAKLPPVKHYDSPYHYKTLYHSDMGNGKCNKSRTRRASRQHNVNGAWRAK